MDPTAAHTYRPPPPKPTPAQPSRPNERQQLLSMETEGGSTRAEAVGWSFECGSTPARTPVGLTRPPAPPHPAPATPRHAIGDGWFLMAPPTPPPEADGLWTWWFTRTVEAL